MSIKIKNKNLCIVQARVGSTRLPGKVLMEVDGTPLLEYLIHRVQQSKKIDKIVVATTGKKEDDAIELLAEKLKIDCFRGAEDDVLSRYYQCSLRYPGYNNIVRLTGDAPLIDPLVIDEVITCFEAGNYDYVSNVIKPTFPDGMDVEIFKKTVLEETAKKAKLPSEREHVTVYILQAAKFRKKNVFAPYDWSHFRLTVDNPEDFEVVKFVIENSKITDSYLKYISLLTKNPQVLNKNSHIKRNEGYVKSQREDEQIKKCSKIKK